MEWVNTHANATCASRGSGAGSLSWLRPGLWNFTYVFGMLLRLMTLSALGLLRPIRCRRQARGPDTTVTKMLLAGAAVWWWWCCCCGCGMTRVRHLSASLTAAAQSQRPYNHCQSQSCILTNPYKTRVSLARFAAYKPHHWILLTGSAP